MKIDHLTSDARDGRTRVSARVVWEDTPRSPLEVYFEASADAGMGLRCNPDAFLVAAFLPAWRHGERRLRIEETVCPELLQGIETAMAVFGAWYHKEHPAVHLEASPRRTSNPTPAPRAASFFSGGIDSMATLRTNHLTYPVEHPGRIKDGFLVFGLEVDRQTAFDHAIASLGPIAADAGITLVPVYTNVRYLDDDWGFWAHEFQDAVLASIAHAFAGRVTVTSIGASDDVVNLNPCGSHPVLDSCYSSFDVRIRHDGLAFTRLAKTRFVAGWEAALQNLRVCNDSARYQAGLLNCGDCEKCVRTMLALEALGTLSRSKAFPSGALTPERVHRAAFMQADTYYYYPELITPLRLRGRDDLANAVQQILRRTHGEVGWRGPIKRLDREYFAGHLVRGVKALAHSVHGGPVPWRTGTHRDW